MTPCPKIKRDHIPGSGSQYSPLKNQFRYTMGVIRVVTRLMRITVTKTGWPIYPCSRPISATIIATSPLGAIPNPMMRASLAHMPVASAGSAHPTTLVIIATTVRTTRNGRRSGVRAFRSATTPSETKKIEENMIFRNSAPSLTSRLVFRDRRSKQIPATNAPTIAESPTSSAIIA